MAGRKAAAALAAKIDPALFPLVLYKRILRSVTEDIGFTLRLHYGLPLPARLMGDIYVKDEWRRHRNASPEHALVFLRGWTEYCVVLSKQLSSRGIAKGELGKDMSEKELDAFSEEQLEQLLELKEQSEQARLKLEGENESKTSG